MCRCRKRYKCPSLRRVPQAQEPQDATERTTVKAPSSRQGLSARLFRLQTRCHRCHSLTSLVQAFQAVTERYTTAEVFASVNTYSSRIDARNALKSLQVFACFGTLQKKGSPARGQRRKLSVSRLSSSKKPAHPIGARRAHQPKPATAADGK